MRGFQWLLALAAVCHYGLAAAAALEDWSLSGYNTLRGEHYGVSGDPASAPYAYTGGQFYDEFGLNLSRRFSPYESLQGQFSGVMNASDYRSNEGGGVLERGRLVWEKGDADLPFRVEAGDFQAGVSPRVIQRALKGVQVELQPGIAGRHSVQVFTGLAAPIYRNLDDNREQASGFSWLLEDGLLGGLSLNAVRAEKAASALMPAYGQDTWSLAWDRQYKLGAHELEAEAEWARFSGEHTATGILKADRGEALFAQLTGRAKPFDYRLRHTRNDGGFRPLEAAITPDQRATEAYLGWLADSGLQSRARFVHATDSYSGANPVDTRTLGYSLGGSLGKAPGKTLSTWLDLSRQSRADSLHTVDGFSDALGLSLGLPLNPALNLRAGVQGNDNHDGVRGTRAISRQASLALDYSFMTRSGWHGRLSPGVLARRSTGRSDQTDLNPTLSLTLGREGHDLSASYSYYQQDAHFNGGVDSLIRQTSLAYTRSLGSHRFGLEANHFSRDPSPGVTASAYRIAATWTWAFDRPARALAQATESSRLADGPGPLAVRDFAPSASLASVKQRLRVGGHAGGLSSPGRDVYELSLLPGVALRQRLVLFHDGDSLRSSALILDFPSGADGTDMLRQYQRVAEALYKQLGTPEARVEEGALSVNLPVDLMQGRFKRWMEWRSGAGVVRMGIPARATGQPRIEIIHAASQPTGLQWGVDLPD